MKLSIHTDIIGKPSKVERDNKGPLYTCNGKVVNLGYGWTNIEVDTWRDAFELITTDGYATSAELSCDHRTDENYVSRQICMVDIDDGMTLQELLNNDFYNTFGAGFYTTARHTDTNHRFRIMFVLEQPETNHLRMRKIIRGLLETFESADRNCKDASRIYYGIPNATIKECLNNILTNEVADALVEMIDRLDEPVKTNYTYDYTEKKYDEIFVSELLSRISQKVGSLKGDYDVFKTIAWATCHTVGQHNANILLTQYWPTKTKKEQQVIKTYNNNKSPTIGTLIKLSGISQTERQLLELQMRLRNMK